MIWVQRISDRRKRTNIYVNNKNINHCQYRTRFFFIIRYAFVVLTDYYSRKSRLAKRKLGNIFRHMSTFKMCPRFKNIKTSKAEFYGIVKLLRIRIILYSIKLYLVKYITQNYCILCVVYDHIKLIQVFLI